MTALSGVRSSWLIRDRNSAFDRAPTSASERVWISSRSRMRAAVTSRSI